MIGVIKDYRYVEGLFVQLPFGTKPLDDNLVQSR